LMIPFSFAALGATNEKGIINVCDANRLVSWLSALLA